MAHIKETRHILDDVAEKLVDVATVEKPSKQEGRSVSLVLAPVKEIKK